SAIELFKARAAGRFASRSLAARGPAGQRDSATRGPAKSATMPPGGAPAPRANKPATPERAKILGRLQVPQNDQAREAEEALRHTVTQIFEKLGVTPEDAAVGADVLTMTDLRGVETHGVSNMLRMYVRDYRAGKLDPRPGWRIVRESPGTAVIDAERRL